MILVILIANNKAQHQEETDILETGLSSNRIICICN